MPSQITQHPSTRPHGACAPLPHAPPGCSSGVMFGPFSSRTRELTLWAELRSSRLGTGNWWEIVPWVTATLGITGASRKRH